MGVYMSTATSTFQFTPEQVEQFKTEGYVAVPDFWTGEEVRAMQVELELLKAKGLIRNVVPGAVAESTGKVNLQLCPMSPHSEFFRAMPFAEKVVAAVSQLIGDPVLLHLDQVFLKPGKHGAGTNWHQDNAYFKIPDPLKGTAIWTAVHDANEANGTMRIIPQSFREELPHDRDPDSDHHIRCWPDESKAKLIELPAGGVLFFCYGTPHATGANTTDKERAGVALHFLNANQDGEARSGFEVSSRPTLTGPNADGGAGVYGESVAGSWEREVVRVLSTNSS
jgi:ectoine hydroxylase-related dioxygenase (phytanoyl-CoA dioxygenase family)